MNKQKRHHFQSTQIDGVTKGKTVTWKEIKKAVEEAGIHENDDIDVIQCENSNGDHTFEKMRLGNKLKLTENVATERAQEEAEGCAV